jgi:hypothetical protein
MTDIHTGAFTGAKPAFLRRNHFLFLLRTTILNAECNEFSVLTASFRYATLLLILATHEQTAVD